MTEQLEAAAQAANLLSQAVKDAHHAASNSPGGAILEYALRDPLRQARELETTLVELLAAVKRN